MAACIGSAFRRQDTVRPFLARVTRPASVSTSRCFITAGNDIEDLRRAWYLDYRRMLASAYETYLRRRIEEGALRPIENPTFAARWLLDSAILFLRLRRLDYYPDELPTEHLSEHLVDMLLHGFAGTGT